MNHTCNVCHGVTSGMKMCVCRNDVVGAYSRAAYHQRLRPLSRCCYSLEWLTPARRWIRVEINSAQKDTARSSHTNCGMQTHTHSFFLIHTTRRTEIFSQNFVCLVSVRSSLVSVCYLDIGLYNSCRTGTATARIPNHMPQQQQDTLGAHVMRMDGCEKLVWGNGGNAPISASSRRAIESPLTLPLWT